MKSVQFSLEVIVLETYSSDEYDRSDIFSTPILYKINPSIVRSTPQLSLNINSCPPNLIRDEEEGSGGEISSAEVSPNTPPSNISSAVNEYFMPSSKKKKRQRPVLSVNTTMCADPLFFTKLSTNYKNELSTPDTSNDFLVPISSIAL